MVLATRERLLTCFEDSYWLPLIPLPANKKWTGKRAAIQRTDSHVIGLRSSPCHVRLILPDRATYDLMNPDLPVPVSQGKRWMKWFTHRPSASHSGLWASVMIWSCFRWGFIISGIFFHDGPSIFQDDKAVIHPIQIVKEEWDSVFTHWLATSPYAGEDQRICHHQHNISAKKMTETLDGNKFSLKQMCGSLKVKTVEQNINIVFFLVCKYTAECGIFPR